MKDLVSAFGFLGKRVCATDQYFCRCSVHSMIYLRKIILSLCDCKVSTILYVMLRVKQRCGMHLYFSSMRLPPPTPPPLPASHDLLGELSF